MMRAPRLSHGPHVSAADRRRLEEASRVFADVRGGDMHSRAALRLALFDESLRYAALMAATFALFSIGYYVIKAAVAMQVGP